MTLYDLIYEFYIGFMCFFFLIRIVIKINFKKRVVLVIFRFIFKNKKILKCMLRKLSQKQNFVRCNGNLVVNL